MLTTFLIVVSFLCSAHMFVAPMLIEHNKASVKREEDPLNLMNKNAVILARCQDYVDE